MEVLLSKGKTGNKRRILSKVPIRVNLTPGHMRKWVILACNSQKRSRRLFKIQNRVDTIDPRFTRRDM